MYSKAFSTVMFMLGGLMSLASHSQANRTEDQAPQDPRPAIIAAPTTSPSAPNTAPTPPAATFSGWSAFPGVPVTQGSGRFEATGAHQASAHARELADKLADPQRRLALREEHREMIVRFNADVGHALKIDAALEERLIELLTDQQMNRLEEVSASGGQRGPFEEELRKRATAHTREIEQLRELLGEEGYQRFADYKATAPERWEVAQFESALPVKDKLDDERRARMIDILRQEREAQTQRRQTRDNPLGHGFLLEGSDSPGTLQRLMARTNYRALAEEEAASVRLLEQLKPVLTLPQFEAYQKLQSERMAAQRRSVEERLTQAGLSPADLDHPDAAQAAQSKPARGRLGFDLNVDVNGSAAKFPGILVANGSAAEVEIADGVTMELTPTYYEDGWLAVSLKFLEGAGASRRVISAGTSFGHAMRLPDGSMNDAARTITNVDGRKGYVVKIELTKVQEKH